MCAQTYDIIRKHSNPEYGTRNWFLEFEEQLECWVQKKKKYRTELGFISSLSLSFLDWKMKRLKKVTSSNVITLTPSSPARRKQQRGLGQSSCHECKKVRLNLCADLVRAAAHIGSSNVVIRLRKLKTHCKWRPGEHTTVCFKMLTVFEIKL